MEAESISSPPLSAVAQSISTEVTHICQLITRFIQSDVNTSNLEKEMKDRSHVARLRQRGYMNMDLLFKSSLLSTVRQDFLAYMITKFNANGYNSWDRDIKGDLNL
jgi:hypothetical protein